MQVRELTGYKKNLGYQQLQKTKRINIDDYEKYPDAEGLSDSFHDFVEMAKKSGWEFKGRGYFGSVLHKPGAKYVYKIYYDDDNTYRQFVSWARSQTGNPYLPVMGPVKKIPGTDGIYTNKIELLQPTQGQNDPRFKQYINTKAANAWMQADGPFKSEAFPLFDQMVATLRQMDPRFEAIAKFAASVGHLDLHYNNVMFRGNQLIVIDPVS